MDFGAVNYRGPQGRLRGFLAGIPAVLAGAAPDPHGIGPPLRRAMARALEDAARADFVTKSRGGTGTDGIRWPPLAASTLARRRKKGRGAAIMLDTGAMMRSVHAGGEGPGRVTLTCGRPLLQRGVPGRLPARPVWPLDGHLPPAWRDRVRSALREAAGRLLQGLLSRGAIR